MEGRIITSGSTGNMYRIEGSDLVLVKRSDVEITRELLVMRDVKDIEIKDIFLLIKNKDDIIDVYLDYNDYLTRKCRFFKFESAKSVDRVAMVDEYFKEHDELFRLMIIVTKNNTLSVTMKLDPENKDILDLVIEDITDNFAVDLFRTLLENKKTRESL